MTYDISFKGNKADYLLSITALLQPVLTLLQLFLMDAMYMDADVANRIRVLLTAVPILCSMFYVLKRETMLTVFTYSVVTLILLFTNVLYPERWAFMSSDVLKFTLPVVLPIGLCIASIHNFSVLAKCMQYISIGAAVIGLLYAVYYLSGVFIIEDYSMAFSYSLLFPTFVMITEKGWLWKGTALIMMIEMLAIGSRGALMLAIAYWFFSLFWGNLSIAKMFMFFLFAMAYFFFFDSLIILLASFFDYIGISSRTLRLLLNDELLSYDSGRNEIYQQTWNLINKNPLFGNGVWADRQYLGTYCHNVFLELFLDFGYFGAGIILIAFFTKQFKIFKKIPINYKTMYLMMLGILTPLLVSSSYLTSFNLGMFLGFTYLVSKTTDCIRIMNLNRIKYENRKRT